jgi:putative Holliday junction resolvase
MRFLALDLGDVRVGYALCDALEIAAYPAGVFHRKGSVREDIEGVLALATQHEADAILIGLPLSLNGDVGPQATKVQGFARRLANKASVPVLLWDESLTSVEADDLMRAHGLSRARRRAKIDQQAAALILESYLAHRRRIGAPADAIV